MARLRGIKVLVTGASTALGRATTGRLVTEGARVIAAHDPDAPTDVLARLAESAQAGSVTMRALDVTDAAGWQAAAAEIESHGELHGVVNNATRVDTGELAEMDPAALARMIDTNLLGPALGIRTMAPLLAAAGGGSIVNVASTEAMRGSRGAAVFSATNWGLRGLTRSVALELGPQGIRVNTVCPSIGLMSPAYAGLDTPREASVALVDGGRARPVTMGDVAAMVTFLLSDDSATCTGGDFLVDAGSTA